MKGRSQFATYKQTKAHKFRFIKKKKKKNADKFNFTKKKKKGLTNLKDVVFFLFYIFDHIQTKFGTKNSKLFWQGDRSNVQFTEQIKMPLIKKNECKLIQDQIQELACILSPKIEKKKKKK